MKLGAFSVSLAVKDINKSKEFYEKLGFESFAGVIEQNWLIMKNENCVIGLFQGMFDKNILTFNPGWDQSANSIDNFEDVRQIQMQLLNSGINLIKSADESTNGPEHIILEDPDGNLIMLDQHV